jgi:radical SAM protein with 4Fe4S-binding SPASM domain
MKRLLVVFFLGFKRMYSTLHFLLSGISGQQSLSYKKWLQFNKGRMNGFQPLLCYAPFRNLFVSLEGRVYICCRSSVVLGTYPEQSIEEIWRSEHVKRIRRNIRRGIFSDECKDCRHWFETDQTNLMFSKTFDRYSFRTRYRYPSSLDLWLDNRCNLECVMCNEFESSTHRMRKNLEPLSMPYDDAFIQSLAPFLPHLKHINCCGGEPFLINIYYSLWELIAEVNPSLRINVLTNGTVLPPKAKELMEKAHFYIMISIDSLNNAIFDVVMKSFEYFCNYSKRKGCLLSVSFTPSTHNWEDLPAMIEFCNKYKTGINISTVIFPKELSLNSLNYKDILHVVEVLTAYHLGQNSSPSRENNTRYMEFVQTITQWKDAKVLSIPAMN